MTVNKRKKVSRLRASHTHKWGAKKKHRGAGHRGGRGNSSTGKRSDARMPSIWKDTKYFGKHGFKTGVPIRAICIRDLEDTLPTLLQQKHVIDEKGVLKIDLANVHYVKLLATGQVKHKWNITVSHASVQAIEKIKKAGGTVEVA